MRLVFHICESRAYTHKRAQWIRSLVAQGLKPKLEILDVVPETEWKRWELEWIRLYRLLGFDLVNSTIGGDGFKVRCGPDHPRFGKKHSPEAIAKMKASQAVRFAKTGGRGKPHTPESRAKIAAALLGKKLSPEQIKKSADGHRGKPHSPEHIAKRVAKLIGHKCPLEVRARIREAQLGPKGNNFGKPIPPEVRLKMSDGMKRSYAARKAIAQHG